MFRSTTFWVPRYNSKHSFHTGKYTGHRSRSHGLQNLITQTSTHCTLKLRSLERLEDCGRELRFSTYHHRHVLLNPASQVGEDRHVLKDTSGTTHKHWKRPCMLDHFAQFDDLKAGTILALSMISTYFPLECLNAKDYFRAVTSPALTARTTKIAKEVCK